MRHALRHHTLILTLSLLTALLVLTGCQKPDTPASANADTLTIEFWHYLAGPQGKAVDDLLRKFEAANPDIKVRAIFQGNPAALKQKLDGSFAAGTSNNPTVSLMYENWTGDFLRRGYIDPVENYFTTNHGLSEDERKDFVTAFIDGNTWDGKLITLPFNKSIYLLHMNMDMMKAAGYTTAPQTRDQLADAIRKTTTRTGNRTSVYGMGIMPKSEALTTLMLAAGGRFIDPATGRLTLNSPQALAALTFLKDLQYPEKHLYVNSDYMSIPLGSNLISSFIYSSASIPYNQKAAEEKFEYTAAPVPGVTGTEPRYLLQGTNIGIFANKTQAQRTAGWKLIRFLTSPENATYFCTRSGYMPYRYSQLEQPEMKTYLAQNPGYATGARLIFDDKGLQEPKIPGWEAIRLEIDKVVDRTLARPDSNPQALLDTLQQQAESKIKQNEK